ncbi:MAG: TVP38/TMEM64 family protein [Clostridiales bacterium]|nr:TVP38/TMEM64 family protein [Clostridiales bacterium]
MSDSRIKNTINIIFAALFVILIAAVFLVPEWREFAKQTVAMFSQGDYTVLQEFIGSYGPYAAAISFFLMIFQSLAAPLPAFLLAFANSALFGFFRGFLLTYVSSLAAASLCFFLARGLGRGAVSRLVGNTGLSEIEKFFERHGGASVLIARLLPFISFDIVSYASGLTAMSFWSFLAATAVGELPATLLYCYAGGLMTGGARKLVYALMIIFALAALAVLLRRVCKERADDENE